jgi:hypothetical protein
MSLHALILLVVAGGIAYLMVFAGMTKRALELRRPRRVCPSCGRTIRDCSCRR